jgi:hypothetical protein
MRKSKFSETQIVSTLKQADAGVPVKDLCRQAGISVATYYQWKSKIALTRASDTGPRSRSRTNRSTGAQHQPNEPPSTSGWSSKSRQVST